MFKTMDRSVLSVLIQNDAIFDCSENVDRQLSNVFHMKHLMMFFIQSKKKMFGKEISNFQIANSYVY